MKAMLRLWSYPVLAAGFLFTGCSDSGSDAATVNYSGPGSFYDLRLNNEDGTFTLAVKEDSQADEPAFTASGSFVRHESGFLTFTVEGVDPEDADGPTVGDTADGFEIPGYAFILKPSGDEGNLIPMIIQGDCPTKDFSANWLIAQNRDGNRDASDADQDWFGNFEYTVDDGKGTVTRKFSLATPAVEIVGTPNSINASSCEDGLLHLDGADDEKIDMWLTANGAMVHSYSDDHESTILALPRPGSALDLADLEGTYSGLVSEGDGENAETFPVKITLDDDGMGTGRPIEDIATDDTASDGADIVLTDAQAANGNGWFTGTLTAGGAGQLSCAANTGIGTESRNILFCVAQSPDDNTHHFIMLLVSR